MEREGEIVTINFKAFLKVLWGEKWLIIVITSLFVLGGAWYAFTAREEFVSEGKILPEVSGAGGSSLGGLANLVGIGGFELGLKNNTDAIRPDLYPDVLGSTPFFLDLLDESFVNRNGDSLLFRDFFHFEIENGAEIKGINTTLPKGKPRGVILINNLTSERLKNLRKRITSRIDTKTGVINIQVKLPDPVVAAQVAKFSMDYLTEYVTAYRTEKLRKEVDFLGEKVGQAKGDYYKDQAKKASYSDQYGFGALRLQSSDLGRERIESEYKISSTLYNELLKKYEEAKIKLQQGTPVFKVLEPPVVPTKKSEPRKSIILIVSFLVGIIFASIVSLIIKKNFQNVIQSTAI